MDGAAITLTLWLAQLLLRQPQNEKTWLVGIVASLVYFVLGEAMGIYRATRSQTPDIELASIVATWFSTLTCLLGIGFLTRSSDTFARSSVLAWFMLAGLFLMLNRMALRSILQTLLKRGVGVHRTAIVGLNSLGIQIAQNAISNPECGLNIIGFYDDRIESRLCKSPVDLPGFKGSIDDLLVQVKSGAIDKVLVTLPMRAESRIQSILTALSDTTASVYIVPDFFVFELLHSRWAVVGGLPVVSVYESPLYGVDGIIKRLLDLVIAITGVIMISPILLICALLVRLSGPGPIIFRQKRYGLDGKEILVWKFRSMNTCDNGTVVKQATKGDSRVTPIGRILRKTSLDELPQLFNVIMGTMSLVGPRPHATAHNEHFRRLIRGYMLRHKVKPGITGLAQVEGSRGETDTIEKMERRIELDHRYIREWSLWLDLKILIKTFSVVFSKEAY